MALRLRRGSNSERLAVTPLAGELVYTTDTKLVFVGDGVTAGGIAVQSGGIVGINDLSDVDTDTSAPNTDDILNYDGANWVPGVNNAGVVTDNAYQISINGADTSILLNHTSRTLTGDVTGDVTGDLLGDVTGNVLGTLDGDVTGSIFGDDSTLLVDGINNSVVSPTVITTSLSATTIVSNTDVLNIVPLSTDASQFETRVVSNSGDGIISIITGSTGDLASSGYNSRLGLGRDDTNGEVVNGSLFGGEDSLLIAFKADGDFLTSPSVISINAAGIGIGKQVPAAPLDVVGEAVFSSSGEFGSYVQVGSVDDTAQAALTPANGMIVYNTSNNKFEGYQNGAWRNLDDGNPAGPN